MSAWDEIKAICKRPPEDDEPTIAQANTFREVAALQAILVTLTIALLAYIQREPNFQAHTDLVFVLLASVPISGLYQIVRARCPTPRGDVYLYTRPIRVYARQSFFLALAIVLGASYFYWRGQLPGQEHALTHDVHSPVMQLPTEH